MGERESPERESLFAVEGLIREDRRNKGDFPCFACGRATDGTRQVHLLTSGFIVAAGSAVDPARDQGWFPIGPECARKVPSGFVVIR